MTLRSLLFGCVFILVYSSNVQCNEKYTDTPNTDENTYLSFNTARQYARCYPNCRTEPEFNALPNSSPNNHSTPLSITKSTSSDIQQTLQKLQHMLSSPIGDALFDGKDIPRSTFQPTPSIISYRSEPLSYKHDVKMDNVGKTDLENNYNEDDSTKDGNDSRRWMHARPRFRIPQSSNLNMEDPVVVCDDTVTFCPGGTCCKMDNGAYGCCPYLSGVCCRNQLQCCPNGYECVDASNSLRDRLHFIFGLPESSAAIRCRIDIAAWIASKFSFKSARTYL